MSVARHYLAFLLTGLLILGCDESGDTTPPADETCEGCQTNNSNLTPEEREARENWEPPVEPVFRVGYNQAGQVDPDAFVDPPAMSTVPVVLGTQGAWMVVVAGMTNQLPCCVDRVDLTASVGEKDAVPLGKIKLKRRPVFRDADGDQYIMNIFLVVPSDPAEWDGKEVELTLEVTPHEGGETITTGTTVILEMVDPAASGETDGTAAN